MFEQDSYRERARRYYSDMAVHVAISTHKHTISEIGHPVLDRLVHEIAHLAVKIALDKYETENRDVIAQADSFERMAAALNAHKMAPVFTTKGAE